LLILGDSVELGDPVPVRDSVCRAEPLLVLEEDRVIEGLGVSEIDRVGVADSEEPAVVVRVWRPVRDIDGDAVAVLTEVAVFAIELLTLVEPVIFADMEPLLD